MHYILWLSRHDFSISLQNERHWSKTNVGVTSGRGPAWSQCTTHAPTPSRPLEARLQKCMRPMCTLNVHTRPALQRHGPSCEGVPTRIRQSGGMTASGQANAGVGHSFGSGATPHPLRDITACGGSRRGLTTCAVVCSVEHAPKDSCVFMQWQRFTTQHCPAKCWDRMATLRP